MECSLITCTREHRHVNPTNYKFPTRSNSLNLVFDLSSNTRMPILPRTHYTILWYQWICGWDWLRCKCCWLSSCKRNPPIRPNIELIIRGTKETKIKSNIEWSLLGVICHKQTCSCVGLSNVRYVCYTVVCCLIWVRTTSTTL